MKKFAVAKKLVKPKLCMRPRAPGQTGIDAQNNNAGRALFSLFAVANAVLKPSSAMRPRAAGHAAIDAHIDDAGRAPNPSFAVARGIVKPRNPLRPRSALGLLTLDAQRPDAGRAPNQKFAVAGHRLKTENAMRPRALGQDVGDTQELPAGRALSFVCGRHHPCETQRPDATAKRGRPVHFCCPNSRCRPRT